MATFKVGQRVRVIEGAGFIPFKLRHVIGAEGVILGADDYYEPPFWRVEVPGHPHEPTRFPPTHYGVHAMHLQPLTRGRVRRLGRRRREESHEGPRRARRGEGESVKAKIKYGRLRLTPESSTEMYAIHQWLDASAYVPSMDDVQMRQEKMIERNMIDVEAS